MGEDAPLIKGALEDCVPVYCVSSLSDAVEQAKIIAQSGDSVLLSPACASFDMFSGFEDRGKQYAAAVRRIS